MNKFDFDQITILVSGFRKKIRKVQNEMLSNYNLSSVHILYLMILLKNKDGLTQTALNERLNVDKANTVRVIKDLEKKGYLIKDTNQPRQKNYKVLLTPNGLEIASKIKQNTQKLHEQIFSFLNEEEKKAIISIIKKLDTFEI